MKFKIFVPLVTLLVGLAVNSQSAYATNGADGPSSAKTETSISFYGVKPDDKTDPGTDPSTDPDTGEDPDKDKKPDGNLDPEVPGDIDQNRRPEVTPPTGPTQPSKNPIQSNNLTNGFLPQTNEVSSHWLTVVGLLVFFAGTIVYSYSRRRQTNEI